MSEEWSVFKMMIRILFPGAELEGDGFKVEPDEKDPRKGTIQFNVPREDPDADARVGFTSLAISRMSLILGNKWTFEVTAMTNESHRGPFLTVKIRNVILLRT